MIYDFQAIAGWHNYFNLRQQALISDAQWTELIGTFERFGERQAAREAWRTFKDIYQESFQGFMAQFFESARGATDSQSVG